MTSELLLAAGKSYLFVFAAILPILNPAATAPIFLGLTEGASPSTRALLARRIARNMFALMVGSMLVGSYVLEFFGISLPIVRVGGGLIVAAAAWRLLNTNHASDDRRTTLAESYTPEQARRQAFYPLTFPGDRRAVWNLIGIVSPAPKSRFIAWLPVSGYSWWSACAAQESVSRKIESSAHLVWSALTAMVKVGNMIDLKFTFDFAGICGKSGSTSTENLRNHLIQHLA